MLEITDVIICANFCEQVFWEYDATEGRYLVFTIAFTYRATVMFSNGDTIL